MTTEDDPQTYANFKWPSRWNDADQIAFVTNVGSEIFFTNCMGVVRCQSTDAQYIAHQLRKAADALETHVRTGSSKSVVKKDPVPHASATDACAGMYGTAEDDWR